MKYTNEKINSRFSRQASVYILYAQFYTTRWNGPKKKNTFLFTLNFPFDRKSKIRAETICSDDLQLLYSCCSAKIRDLCLLWYQAVSSLPALYM